MSIRPLLLLLCGISVHFTSASPETLELTLFSSPQVVCNDGSPAGIYYRLGDPSKFIVHFQGGAWCDNAEACMNRSILSPHLTSSKTWAENLIVDGIFNNDPDLNPGWANATKIFLPYCTSDSFSGTAASSSFGFSFLGKYVVQYAINFMTSKLGFASAQEVLVSGCSAGGSAVIANIDLIHQSLPSTTLVKGYMDAGWWLDIDSVAGSPVFREGFIIGQPLWGGQTDESCMQQFKSELWRCYIAEYALPYIDTPLLMHQETTDSAQLYADGLRLPLTGPEIAYIGLFRRDITEQLAAVSAPNAVFAPSCITHCISESAFFFNITLTNSGVTNSDVLYDYFLKNQTGNYIDDCKGINCSKNCPPI
eukprot:TRINITY_DN540_c0_g1_i1.p1 TRINITY_DN540_c0_g1~~TRINITY_DN540_c0_g1_i1.p1  ORF type:complete len:365 (-),score=58.18 TRINITY_DN540_c0_g1_i1:25-1119(-)